MDSDKQIQWAKKWSIYLCTLWIHQDKIHKVESTHINTLYNKMPQTVYSTMPNLHKNKRQTNQ